MLDLVVLNRAVQLPFGCVLEGRLFFSILDHHQALGYPVELILQHYHAFKIDRYGAFAAGGRRRIHRGRHLLNGLALWLLLRLFGVRVAGQSCSLRSMVTVARYLTSHRVRVSIDESLALPLDLLL